MHQGACRYRRPRGRATGTRAPAAGILLDRGWGRAPQAHTGEDSGDIRVIIRQIVEENDVDVGPSGTTAKLVS